MAEVERRYYDTSELESEVYMVNGKKNGIYNRNGELKENYYYNDGKVK